MQLVQLIERIKNTPDCTVYESEGLPQIGPKHYLPEDVIQFYKLCGGLSLFENASYSVKIPRPSEVVLANPVLIDAEIIQAEIAKGTYDQEPSTDWYIIANLYNSDYIVIDLSREKLGQCYQAFWDLYPSEGDMPIIAKSFTELLERLVDNSGEYWFFLQKDFESYGDAYDDVD